jgi:hypothetical protein
MTINPQRFGQKYVGKVFCPILLSFRELSSLYFEYIRALILNFLNFFQVANPQDILIFSKASKKGRNEGILKPQIDVVYLLCIDSLIICIFYYMCAKLSLIASGSAHV